MIETDTDIGMTTEELAELGHILLKPCEPEEEYEDEA